MVTYAEAQPQFADVNKTIEHLISVMPVKFLALL